MTSARIEQWNQRYRAGEQVFDSPAPLVVEFAGDLTPGAVLDLAAGAGRNALYLAERGWRAEAVDGSPVAIELLLTRARQRNLIIDARAVDLETGDLEIPSAAFDLVLSCYYWQRSLIPLMKSAVRDGGRVIVIAHVDPEGSSARAHPGELRALFDDWRILHYREGQPGESCHRHAVAELVAQKPGGQ